MTVNTGLELK